MTLNQIRVAGYNETINSLLNVIRVKAIDPELLVIWRVETGLKATRTEVVKCCSCCLNWNSNIQVLGKDCLNNK